MILKRYTKLILFTLCSLPLFSQDLHFSQFEKTPLLFNPGNTGNFKGTIRLGAIYRDQWRNFGNFHSTPSFFVDAPVIKGFGKNDWVGAGGVIFQDRAGSGQFGNGAFLLSGAYHMATGEQAKNVWSLGVQYGTGSLRMRRPFNLTFEDALIAGPGLPSIDESKIPMDPQRYTDFNVGFVYTHKLSEFDERFQVGLSVSHISIRRDPTAGIGPIDPDDPDPDPNEGPGLQVGGGGGRFGLLPSTFYVRPFRYNLMAALDMKYNEKIILRPAMMAQLFGNHLQIIVNAIGGIVINEEDDIALVGGLGYRVNDSAIAHFGIDYKTFRAGLAWDINVSSLGAASAFELGLTYIVRIQKRPDVHPVIFCPRF